MILKSVRDRQLLRMLVERVDMRVSAPTYFESVRKRLVQTGESNNKSWHRQALLLVETGIGGSEAAGANGWMRMTNEEAAWGGAVWGKARNERSIDEVGGTERRMQLDEGRRATSFRPSASAILCA